MRRYVETSQALVQGSEVVPALNTKLGRDVWFRKLKGF